MSYQKNPCEDLLDAPFYIAKLDLLELQSRYTRELLDDARELYDKMRTFEKKCLRDVLPSIQPDILSMYQLALLKLSVALEAKLEGASVDDEFASYIINYFTPDEKQAVRDLEKFSKLDPNVTPPEILAEIIVSESGEIYRLIKEAVEKGYVDFGRILKTWESNYRIRNSLTRAFSTVYQARFTNIINTIERLLHQQPAWLKRIFREYEDALLSSAEVRKKFEEEYKRVFTEKIQAPEDTLRRLEEENSALMQRIIELTSKATVNGEEEERVKQEIAEAESKYKPLVTQYKSLLESFTKDIAELEGLKRQLMEKEEQLRKLLDSPDQPPAAKVALENEVNALRERIKEYEDRLGDYRVIEERLAELESVFKTLSEGNLVTLGEIEYFYEVYASKAKALLEDKGVRIANPLSGKEIPGGEWDYVERKEAPVKIGYSTVVTRSISFVKQRGLIMKKKDLVVDYVYAYHKPLNPSASYDKQPIGLSEFIQITRPRIRSAEDEGYYNIVILVSPTGFTSKLINNIQGGETSTGIISKHATIYLVDPVKGAVYYNQYDTHAKINSHLARIEVSEEAVEKVVQYASSKEAMIKALRNSPSTPYLTLREIKEETGVTSEAAVRIGLQKLEEEGTGEVKIVNNEPVLLYKKLA